MRKLILPLVLGLLVLSACATAPQQVGFRPSAPAAANGATTTTCNYRLDGSPAKPVDPPAGDAVAASGTVTFVLQFGAGKVTLTADRAEAPCTVNSFEALVKQSWFDGTRCHRLADSGLAMLQCGDPTATGRGGPGYAFDDELKPTMAYTAGTVAMANAGPGTNGSQFFIVYRDSGLPPDYTIFAHLDEASLQVMEKIAGQSHDNSWGDGTGVPTDRAEIVSATVG